MFSLFLPGENIDGVMETTLKCLTTVAYLPLQNSLGRKSSPSVVTEAGTELSEAIMHCCLPLAAFPPRQYRANFFFSF